ncbi:hypothetical protein [Thalassoglobus polymorphus]|uniref:Uncharacterized protein n=1 Tax=Thalassoglobus polymorphus TaxID=2527994 RepID=A0A517QP91_9PLAN|nr:hypothetical protein [Thalassoglobus polymorphus]QDT33407.1 hypothetical protein Mal48_26600 [Thalassoglobus polymorphus]
MWCASCQDDVAAEISEDGQVLKCTTCGESIRQVFAPSLHPETKSARDLLKKWAEEQQQLVGDRQPLPSEAPSEEPQQETSPATSPVIDIAASDQVASDQAASSQSPSSESPSSESPSSQSPSSENTSSENASLPEASSKLNEEEPVVEQVAEPIQNEKKKPKFRIDAAHSPTLRKFPEAPSPPAAQPPVNQPPAAPQDLVKSEVVENVIGDDHETEFQDDDEDVEDRIPFTHEQAQSTESQREHYSHSAHVQAPAPHFDVVAAAKQSKSRPGRSEVIWGQLMAYAGVGVLTVGTILVLWGYFGMVEQYASTGWLLSTAGQMLLLLGIVTLVSGGMQQTTHEVTERIEYLGGRMIRIEQSTDQLLKGPHLGKKTRRQKESEFGDEKSSTS